jgi:hypothetical protein
MTDTISIAIVPARDGFAVKDARRELVYCGYGTAKDIQEWLQAQYSPYMDAVSTPEMRAVQIQERRKAQGLGAAV